jgi:DHA2 family multidrug resistance protein-like MFS transporter
MPEAQAPAGLPPGAWEASRAGLGAAMAVVQDLPAPLGSALQDAARGAFMQGMRATAFISAALMAATAVVFAWTMRHALRRPAGKKG